MVAPGPVPSGPAVDRGRHRPGARARRPRRQADRTTGRRPGSLRRPGSVGREATPAGPESEQHQQDQPDEREDATGPVGFREAVLEGHVVRRRHDDHHVRREPIRTLRAAHLPVREVRLLDLDRLAQLVDVERDLVDGTVHVAHLRGRDARRCRADEVATVDALPVVRSALRELDVELRHGSPTTARPCTPTARGAAPTMSCRDRARPSTASTNRRAAWRRPAPGSSRRRDRCPRPGTPSNR